MTFFRDVGAKLKKRQRENNNTLLTQGAEYVLRRGQLMGLPFVRDVVRIQVSDVLSASQWRVIGMSHLEARLSVQEFEIREPVLELRDALVPRATITDVFAELTHPTN